MMAAVYRSSRGQTLVHLLLFVWRGNPVWRPVLLLLRLLADASFRSIGHGYLDPGTGSIIVSAVVAGFAGIGVMFRTMGKRITSPFRRKSKTVAE